ncbi:unnamed protein product [Coffea canephora]|uniref:F-box domain-containing protein n=1 Tax=Coffea canephora TaxID=49390 RepID=A0A068TRV2_COFCA|nr:unnamed protein product [Coffea canephora]
MDQSNQRLEFFPDDVILQILARLPVKALTRIKCVCKLWYQLASGDYFRHVHNELSIRNPMVLVEVTDTSSESRSSLICVDNLRGVYEFSLDFIKARVKVRASCNGLLCCSSIPDKGVYYVCNPMTREYKMLPRSRERPVTRFYPDGEATLVGLACNLLTHNYNVVLAGYHRPFGHRPERTFIYDHFTHMNRNQVVFINGSLHWLTGSCTCLLVLDLECDMWRRILLPNETGEYVFLATHKQVLVYQLKNKVWKEMYSVKNSSTLPLWFSAHAFRSTIFSCH